MALFKHDSESGQTLPLVALFLLVLMGMLALAIDGGYAYSQRRSMQNAADAGALAAATVMVNGELNDSVIRNTAWSYAQRNGAESYTLAYLDVNKNPIAGPTNAEYIRVTASKTFPTFFARVLSVDTITASARATAHAFPTTVPVMGGVMPFSLPYAAFAACPAAGCSPWNSQYVKDWGPMYGTPSNFKGLIDLSDGGCPPPWPGCVGDWVSGAAAPPPIYVGQNLPGGNGDIGANVAKNLRDRLGCPAAGSGVVYIPIWDSYSAATDRFHIATFAALWINCSDISGSTLTGHFVNWAVPGYTHGNGTQPAGPRVVLLTE